MKNVSITSNIKKIQQQKKTRYTQLPPNKYLTAQTKFKNRKIRKTRKIRKIRKIFVTKLFCEIPPCIKDRGL